MITEAHTLPYRGEVLLQIVFSKAPSPKQLDDLDYRLNTFFVASDAGMFCGAHFPPEQSHAVAIERLKRDKEIQIRCEFQAIDAGAFRILRGIIFHYSIYTAMIERSSALLQPKGASDLLQMKVPLPAAYHTPEFPVVRHEPARRDKWRLVHIQLVRRLDPEQMTTLLEQLSAWEEMCFGGYAEDFLHPENSGIAPGDLYFVDPYTIEYGIDGLLVAEEAFNGIINFSARVHRTVCQVSKVKTW